MQMYRVVFWHRQGRGMDRTPMSLDDALAEAARLRKLYCVPGGGLMFVGIEEVTE